MKSILSLFLFTFISHSAWAQDFSSLVPPGQFSAINAREGSGTGTNGGGDLLVSQHYAFLHRFENIKQLTFERITSLDPDRITNLNDRTSYYEALKNGLINDVLHTAYFFIPACRNTQSEVKPVIFENSRGGAACISTDLNQDQTLDGLIQILLETHLARVGSAISFSGKIDSLFVKSEGEVWAYAEMKKEYRLGFPAEVKDFSKTKFTKCIAIFPGLETPIPTSLSLATGLIKTNAQGQPLFVTEKRAYGKCIAP